MLRRSFLRAVAGSTLFSLAGFRSEAAKASAAVFAHGVASGDPLSDRVILWTRISGASGATVRVRWRVATDEAMTNIVQDGQTATDATRDFTVKVDARRLPAATELYYRFEVDGAISPVGRTRTLATGTLDRARLAVVSCANYPYGFFNVYREIAAREDLDAVVHLGDYIYEYGMGEYGTEHAERLGRIPEPDTETASLADYRRRHAQYKADPDSLAMHAKHPLIAVWDDHELGNDAWRAGAENHQVDEGRWAKRRDAAIRAYLEWMPVRAHHDREGTRIFRSFEFGDLLSLIMLDTRVYGRDVQPDVGVDVTAESVQAAMRDPERRMLGYRQEGWLRRRLKRSEAVWQVIGQQVLATPVKSPDLEPLLDLDKPSMLSQEALGRYIAMSKSNPPMLLDTWDGYPVARQDFLADLQSYARNPVVISGDLHTPLAGNLTLQGQQAPVAVEFMTGSVTSPGFAEYLPEKEPGLFRDATLALNPALAYLDTDRRGWMCLTITRDDCKAEWHALDTVHSRDYTSTLARTLAVRAGSVSDGLYEP